MDACGQSSGHWIVKGGPWQREEGTRTEALGGLVGAGSAESLEDGDAAREPASGTGHCQTSARGAAATEAEGRAGAGREASPRRAGIWPEEPEGGAAPGARRSAIAVPMVRAAWAQTPLAAPPRDSRFPAAPRRHMQG